jgi:hypothetical protein
MSEKTTTTSRPYERTHSVPESAFGHLKPEAKPEKKRADQSNREAAHARAEHVRATHEDAQPAPIELPSPGIVADPKVLALIESGKDLEVGGDNILREVKTDKTPT